MPSLSKKDDASHYFEQLERLNLILYMIKKCLATNTLAQFH